MFKMGDKSMMSNYTPTSVVGKLFKSIIAKKTSVITLINIISSWALDMGL